MNIAHLYNGLNRVCFRGQLRPVTIRLVPWIVNERDERLAGAWVADKPAIALDRALLWYPVLLFGVLLHEMVHQACHERDGVTGHGENFLCTGTSAAVRLRPLGVQVPMPTNGDANTWPYPVARHLLGEM